MQLHQTMNEPLSDLDGFRFRLPASSPRNTVGTTTPPESVPGPDHMSVIRINTLATLIDLGHDERK